MDESVRRCPFCDEEIRANAIKCRHCGSMLVQETNAPSVDTITAVRAALSHKYSIVEEIGRGGMAIVYKALQTNLDRVVALKVLPQNLLHDREIVTRFHHEARSIARINHRHVVAVYDEGVEGQIHYIAMEYLEGSDLHALVRQKGHLAIEEAVATITSVAEALDHAHAQGVIHRDVKSANIIVTKEGRAVLTDFGIARATSGLQLTVSGSVLGTPEYMSPEQASGAPVDARSDLYSLGIVLYECVTGELPFRGDNPLTVISRIINEPHPRASTLGSIPRWVDYAIERCLEKSPEKRVQSGKELVDILRSHEVPIGFTASSTVRYDRHRSQGGASARLNRILLVLLSLLVISISVLIVLLLRQGGTEKILPAGEARQLASRPEGQEVRNTGAPQAAPGSQASGRPDQTKRPEGRTNVIPADGSHVSVAVPNVTGLTEVQAAEQLKRAGLRAGTITRIAASREQAGRIVKQVPKSGNSAKAGDPVHLIVGE
jgi:serine/threonine protein kinase